MDWFSFLLNGFTLTAQGCLQLSFAGWFTGKQLKVQHFAAYLFLLYASDLAASAFSSSLFTLCTALLILYGINRLMLNNSRPVSCVTAALAVYVAQISFGMIAPLEFLFFPNALGRTLLLHLIVVLATLLAISLCLFCYKFIANRFSLDDNRREPYIWMLLTPILFFFGVEFYIFNTAYERVLTVPYTVEVSKHLSLLGLQLLGLGALFCTLFAYQRTSDGLRAEAELSSLAQETYAQKTYVAQAQMRYERTRAFRHDIRNHLSILDGLLKHEDYQQARKFLLKLEAATGELTFPVYTGNAVVDILLGDKLSFAKEKGAKVEISLCLPRPCAVSDLDFCIIFANALDNAIQACLEIDGKKSIRICGEQQGEFYMLEFENTCASKSTPAMGTGLSNVKAVAERYGGAIVLEKSFSLFRLNVLLNISRHPGDNSIQSS